MNKRLVNYEFLKSLRKIIKNKIIFKQINKFLQHSPRCILTTSAIRLIMYYLLGCYMLLLQLIGTYAIQTSLNSIAFQQFMSTIGIMADSSDVCKVVCRNKPHEILQLVNESSTSGCSQLFNYSIDEAVDVTPETIHDCSFALMNNIWLNYNIDNVNVCYLENCSRWKGYSNQNCTCMCDELYEVRDGEFFINKEKDVRRMCK